MRTCKVVIPYSLSFKRFVSYALVTKSDNPNAIATMAPMYAAPEIIKPVRSAALRTSDRNIPNVFTSSDPTPSMSIREVLGSE